MLPVKETVTSSAVSLEKKYWLPEVVRFVVPLPTENFMPASMKSKPDSLTSVTVPLIYGNVTER